MYPFKRSFDLFFSIAGLLLLSPLLFLLAILIKCSDGGPVFFRQIRVGQHGKLFRLWKYRTMVVHAEELGALVTKKGDGRITRIGRFLRRTKLDELPQLWNVLRGEMSFVGPRPEVARYVERYTPAQREALEYKPGITDLATLLFRDEETLLQHAENVDEFYVQHCIPPKINLNLQYAAKANLFQDTWIILQTLFPYWVGILLMYSTALVASFWISYQLRFEFEIPRSEFNQFTQLILWIIPIKLVFLLWRKQFHGLLSYFSIPELQQIGTALSLSFLIQMTLWYASEGKWVPPRSIILIDFLLSLFVLCSIRLIFRTLRESYFSKDTAMGNKVARIGIIGAGEAGAKLARDFDLDRTLGRKVTAFFDDNPYKWQKFLHNIPIVGMPECLSSQTWRENLDEVIIAMPDAPSQRIQEIQKILSRARLRSLTISPLGQSIVQVNTEDYSDLHPSQIPADRKAS